MKSIVFSATPLALHLLPEAEAQALSKRLPLPPKTTHVAMVAAGANIWFEMLDGTRQDVYYVSVIRAVPSIVLGEIRHILERTSDAGFVMRLPEGTPLEALQAAIGAPSQRVLHGYQALVARTLQTLPPRTEMEVDVSIRQTDDIPVMRQGTRSIPLLPETAEGRVAGRLLAASLERLRRLHSNGMLRQTFPRLAAATLRALTPEQIQSRLDAIGLGDIPMPEPKKRARAKA